MICCDLTRTVAAVLFASLISTTYANAATIEWPLEILALVISDIDCHWQITGRWAGGAFATGGFSTWILCA
jgi:hypothetical protein